MYELLYSFLLTTLGVLIGYIVRCLQTPNEYPEFDEIDRCACPYCGKVAHVAFRAAYHIECPKCLNITPAHDWLPVIRKGT